MKVPRFRFKSSLWS